MAILQHEPVATPLPMYNVEARSAGQNFPQHMKLHHCSYTLAFIIDSLYPANEQVDSSV